MMLYFEVLCQVRDKKKEGKIEWNFQRVTNFDRTKKIKKKRKKNKLIRNIWWKISYVNGWALEIPEMLDLPWKTSI